jgi:hypothetical protein
MQTLIAHMPGFLRRLVPLWAPVQDSQIQRQLSRGRLCYRMYCLTSLLADNGQFMSGSPALVAHRAVTRPVGVMVVAVVNMGVLGPLVHGRAEVAVVRQPAGDDQFATARSSGYRGGAGVALQRVRRVKLLDVVTDFAGDAGGEAIPEAGEAEVDFIARDRFSRVGIPGLVGAALAAIAQQELTHAAHPVPPGLAQGQQLGRGERDGGGLSPDQVVAHRQLLGGQGVKDTHREPARPAMARGAREAFKGIFAGLRFGRNAVSRLSFKRANRQQPTG